MPNEIIWRGSVAALTSDASQGGHVQQAIRLAIVPVVAVIMTAATLTVGVVTLAAQGAVASSEACSLLTAQDATTALGEAVKGPAAAGGRSSTGPSSCEYSGSGIHK